MIILARVRVIFTKRDYSRKKESVIITKRDYSRKRERELFSPKEIIPERERVITTKKEIILARDRESYFHQNRLFQQESYFHKRLFQQESYFHKRLFQQEGELFSIKEIIPARERERELFSPKEIIPARGRVIFTKYHHSNKRERVRYFHQRDYSSRVRVIVRMNLIIRNF